MGHIMIDSVLRKQTWDRWYAKHKDTPEFKRKNREKASQYYQAHRTEILSDPEIKRRVSQWSKRHWQQVKDDPKRKSAKSNYDSIRGRKMRSTGEGNQKLRASQVAWKKRLRAKLFEIYGHECACCGEQEKIFLTLDHVHNNGKEERESMTCYDIYKKAIANPVSGEYQVLCWNCQMGKRYHNGVCPHKERIPT